MTATMKKNRAVRYESFKLFLNFSIPLRVDLIDNLFIMKIKQRKEYSF